MSKFIKLKKAFILAITAAGLFLCLSNANALEEIIFQNGDKISGNITSYTDGIFHVETNFGPISIPKSEIEKINFTKNDAAGKNTKSITTPDDFLSFIQTCKFNFFIDSEKMNAQNFSNQLRLRWAMKHSKIKDLEEFLEKVTYYSPVTGKHNQVEIEKGRKIKVCDWADSILKNSGKFDGKKNEIEIEKKQKTPINKETDSDTETGSEGNNRKTIKK